MDAIEARLKALKNEFETGLAELQKVEARRAYLQETLLRIDGAAQVLQELLESRVSDLTKEERIDGEVKVKSPV